MVAAAAAVQAGARGGESRRPGWRTASSLVTAFQIAHDC